MNDDPTITSNPITTVSEDSSYSYNLIASDPDQGDTLTLSAPTLPSWLSFNAGNGILSGTPTNTDIGSHNITLRATDANGAVSNQTFTVNVTMSSSGFQTYGTSSMLSTSPVVVGSSTNNLFNLTSGSYFENPNEATTSTENLIFHLDLMRPFSSNNINLI